MALKISACSALSAVKFFLLGAHNRKKPPTSNREVESFSDLTGLIVRHFRTASVDDEEF
jgi:hypothetical protein